jgi:hypothetical protein
VQPDVITLAMFVGRPASNLSAPPGLNPLPGALQRGNHEAFVVAPGRVRMRVLFDTTARADTELDLPVPRAGKIVGRVTERFLNEAWPKAQLSCCEFHYFRESHARESSAG